MIDIRLIRTETENIRANLTRRNNPAYLELLDKAVKLDEEWRKNNVEVENLRARRNSVSKEIAEAKKSGKDASKVMQEAKDIPNKIADIEQKSLEQKAKLDKLMMKIPNLLHESVPTGNDDTGNVVLRERGKKTKHSVETVSHAELLEKLGMADFARAAKVAGARFYYLMGDIVRLELALQIFALDKLAKKGFTPVLPPYMMRREPYEGVTDLEDFEKVLYRIADEDLFMIATSEHPLAALHMGEALDEKVLPLRYVGVSPSFRKEAGTHGKDTKGIFRVHHFNKVEQFILCKAEESWDIFDNLISNAEEIFSELGLAYRIVNICTGDIGTVAAKKYDLEVWMPAQGCYREAVSCSNCTDYQARRLSIKYSDGSKREYVHTLNSTGIATTRALVAILENFQEKDGSVRIPDVLVPYMGGIKKLVSKHG